MELRNSLFDCTVFHGRIKPVKNSFVYSYFMFLIALDEDPFQSVRLAGFGKRALYSFREDDHFRNGNNSTLYSIQQEFAKLGIDPHKIFLLTNLRTAGHQFNPVSFYFATSVGQVIGIIAEVGNTFGEQKLFPLTLSGNRFTARSRKEFYVSPYSALDAEFEFFITFKNDKIDIRINTLEDDKPVLYSRLEGSLKTLSDAHLLKYTLKFPMVTLKVITMIHWQAFKIWLKKAPFIRKKENSDLQKNHYKVR